jgi:hypothetical protein
MPKPILRGAAVGALLGALALAGTASAGPSGAAFTTDVNGTVNQNHYAATTDVHLNGGPCNTPSRARLADGWYSFKVTDPSGRVDLSLSSDPVAARTFRVKSGKIAYSTAAHPVVPTPCGAVVRVGPFKAESRNGEYKLWIAPKGSGFARRKAKTDNFRCDPDAAPPVELPPTEEPPTQQEPPAEDLPGDEVELPKPPEQTPPTLGKPSDDDGSPAHKPPAHTPGSDKPPPGSPGIHKPPTTKPPSTRPTGPCKPPSPPPPCTRKPPPPPPDPTPDPTPDPGF